MSYRDIERRKAYLLAWRREHREDLNRRQRERRAADPEHASELDRRHRRTEKAKATRARWKIATAPQRRVAERLARLKDPVTYRAKHRAFNLMARYCITVEDYLWFRAIQDEKCPLCLRDFEPFDSLVRLDPLDHDPVTGKARGVLCHPCNQNLGRYHDSREALLAIAAVWPEKRGWFERAALYLAARYIPPSEYRQLVMIEVTP